MINDLFHDQAIIRKIQSKLPELFYIAELESSRAGKIGMEVGSVREKILIALLIHKFGLKNIQTDLPIHESEIDVIVHGKPLSIKTITGKRLGAIKLIWTVDRHQALLFGKECFPKCGILLAHINWGGVGGLHLISKDLQVNLMNRIGREEYLTLPKPGTNPRGVEMSTMAVRSLTQDPQCLTIPVKWNKREKQFDPYKRWLELWEQD